MIATAAPRISKDAKALEDSVAILTDIITTLPEKVHLLHTSASDIDMMSRKVEVTVEELKSGVDDAGDPRVLEYMTDLLMQHAKTHSRDIRDLRRALIEILDRCRFAVSLAEERGRAHGETIKMLEAGTPKRRERASEGGLKPSPDPEPTSRGGRSETQATLKETVGKRRHKEDKDRSPDRRRRPRERDADVPAHQPC